MTDHPLIPLSDREGWETALADVPHGFHHTWDFAQMTWLTTGYTTYLHTLAVGDGRSVCAFVERPVGDQADVASVSGFSGFAGTASAATIERHWNELAAERGWVSGYIGLNPIFEPPGYSDATESHNDIYTLDLRLGPEALRDACDRSRRRELRGWEERAQTFSTDREAICAFLLEHYEPFMKAVGARPPLLSRESIEFLCASERCVIVGAPTESTLDAVYVFGATPHCADCFLAVSAGEGRRHLTDLLWYGVSEYSRRGVPAMNLGGGTSRDDAIAQAKQRFRPERRPMRALRQVYRPDAYKELCGAAPSPASEGWFPAYRAPGESA